jgi:hypothetical protein
MMLRFQYPQMDRTNCNPPALAGGNGLVSERAREILSRVSVPITGRFLASSFGKNVSRSSSRFTPCLVSVFPTFSIPDESFFKTKPPFSAGGSGPGGANSPRNTHNQIVPGFLTVVKRKVKDPWQKGLKIR